MKRSGIDPQIESAHIGYQNQSFKINYTGPQVQNESGDYCNLCTFLG